MADLARRPLGRTGLSVTPLCVGTSALGSMPHLYGYAVDTERASATLRATFAGPINFLDTSNDYAGGEAERRIGAVLAEIGGLPDGYVVATKIDPSRDGGELDFTGERARRSVAESRSRLGLEALQLVYLHDPERISFEEAMAPDGPVAAMRRLHDDGVIAHLGVAGGPIDLLSQFVATGLFEVLISHNRYTLLDRSALALFEQCAVAGVAVVNGAPFGGGMLAKGPDTQPRYGYRETAEEIRERARAMQRACERRDVPLAAAALQFSLRQPLITSTIVGVTRPERIAETLDHAALPIPEELWEELDALAAPEALWLR
ncbi:MAG: aldo/keto reductase [Actinomycetota bacterium]|nr:aldo/keto reductase [Actinomycetota bacterium]